MTKPSPPTAGKCVITGPGGNRLAYKVDSNCGGALYFCKTSPHTFTLEFLGGERSLPPGDSIKITQEFTIIHN